MSKLKQYQCRVLISTDLVRKSPVSLMLLPLLQLVITYF